MLRKLAEDAGIGVARNELHFGQMKGETVKRGEIKPRALLFRVQLALRGRLNTSIEGIAQHGDLVHGSVGADLVRAEKIDAGLPERPAFGRFGDPLEVGEGFFTLRGRGDHLWLHIMRKQWRIGLKVRLRTGRLHRRDKLKTKTAVARTKVIAQIGQRLTVLGKDGKPRDRGVQVVNRAEERGSPPDQLGLARLQLSIECGIHIWLRIPRIGAGADASGLFQGEPASRLGEYGQTQGLISE